MTDVSALTDLPTPVNTDYILSWRGSAPYRFGLSNILFKDATTGVVLMSKTTAAGISADGDGGTFYLGSAFYSAAWRNTVTGQGGAAIRNSGGVFTIYTGTNPGAAGSVISDMSEKFRLDANGNISGTVGTTIVWKNALIQGDGSDLYVRPTNGSGSYFLGAGNTNFYQITPTSGIFRPVNDNTQSLGDAVKRFSVVYAGTGTINTSDEREKQWRGSLSEAELKAAKKIAKEIGVYQWLDAVAEKDEKARLHIGVRAQRVFKILEECGLNWQTYAWCCYDKWEDEYSNTYETKPCKHKSVDAENNEVEIDGFETISTGVKLTRKAGDRYGVRPDQLAMFLIAAQEQRLAALEAALA